MLNDMFDLCVCQQCQQVEDKSAIVTSKGTMTGKNVITNFLTITHRSNMSFNMRNLSVQEGPSKARLFVLHHSSLEDEMIAAFKDRTFLDQLRVHDVMDGTFSDYNDWF